MANSDLRGTWLGGANLAEADLSGADLSGDWYKALLSGPVDEEHLRRIVKIKDSDDQEVLATDEMVLQSFKGGNKLTPTYVNETEIRWIAELIFTQL